MDVKQAVQAQFGAVADRYARSAGHLAGPDLDALVEAAELTGSESVLDVGCGTGHTTRAVAGRAARVTGIDLTEAMLAEARRLAREDGLDNLEFRHGDAESLPFEDAAFDVVSCRLCAHHFADPVRAVAEAARVLRPGGRFLMVDSVAPEDPALDTFLNGIELLRDPSHVRNHRVSEWLAWLEAAGLCAEHRGAYPMVLEFDSWFERMQTPGVQASAVRALFEGASDAAREVFAYRPEAGTWTIPIVLVRGVARA
jgi:SAM-dependent methyltransferase